MTWEYLPEFFEVGLSIKRHFRPGVWSTLAFSFWAGCTPEVGVTSATYISSYNLEYFTQFLRGWSSLQKALPARSLLHMGTLFGSRSPFKTSVKIFAWLWKKLEHKLGAYSSAFQVSEGFFCHPQSSWQAGFPYWTVEQSLVVTLAF